MNLEAQKMKKFFVRVETQHTAQELPVWGRTIEEALEAADLEYGADNVMRIRPEVAQ